MYRILVNMKIEDPGRLGYTRFVQKAPGIQQ
jgi:hypothetical protein